MENQKKKEISPTRALSFRKIYNDYYRIMKGGHDMFNPRKDLEKHVVEIADAAENYEIGSEEYYNACRSANQLAEAAQKCKRVDLNQMIPGIASIGMFVIYMIFNEKNITDTRGIQFVKGLFKK